MMDLLSKEWKKSLDAIGVYRQKYYGGIFVGNHVHKILQVKYITIMIAWIGDAVHFSTQDIICLRGIYYEVYTKFHSILSKFGRCHSLYDSTVVTQ